MAIGARTGGAGGPAFAGAVRTAGTASAPAAVPLVIANVLGHGGRHLVEHFGKPPTDQPATNQDPFHPGGNR
jgi:hypothetical protein